MIERDDFDLQVVAWLANDAGDETPAYLDAVQRRVERTRQRPAWATIPRWRPVERTWRSLDVAPAFLILLLIGLLLLVVAAAVFVGTPPPRPGPLIALPEPRQPTAESPRPLPEAARVAELEFHGPDFYAVPRPLTPGSAGALVYLQRMDNPSWARVYRVLYHSRSVSGRDIAVSGTIWVPASAPPSGGHPIVSFGMDDDGSADMCAMSRFDAPSIDGSWGGLMTLLLRAGYVVAFSDYEGWGTTDPYPFAVLDSSAHTMLDAARAARDLLGPAASNRVVLFGYGLGADAAATAGERAATYAPDLDVRGVIAADGGDGDYEALINEFVARGASSGPPTGILQGIAGFSVAYPELRPADVLSPLGLEDISHLESMCWTEFDQLVSGQSAPDVLAVNPLDVPRWLRRIKAMLVTGEPSPTFLMATGDSGAGVDIPGVAARFCRANGAVLVRGYPNAMAEPRNMGNDPYEGVYVISWPDVRPWIADRFAGAAPVGNCDG